MPLGAHDVDSSFWVPQHCTSITPFASLLICAALCPHWPPVLYLLPSYLLLFTATALPLHALPASAVYMCAPTTLLLLVS